MQDEGPGGQAAAQKAPEGKKAESKKGSGSGARPPPGKPATVVTTNYSYAGKVRLPAICVATGVRLKAGPQP